jgi:hypothetical protein
MMIDNTAIMETILERVRKLPEGHYLDVRTYKRNRYVFIVKQREEEFVIIEHGYADNRFTIRAEKLKKELTTIFRREFPRSHKIRLYTMGKFADEEALTIRRKIL